MRPTRPSPYDQQVRASVTRIVHHASTIATSILRATVASAHLVMVSRAQLNGEATVQDVRSAAQALDGALAPMVSAFGEIDGHLKALADLEHAEAMPVRVQGVAVVRGVVGAC